MSRTAEIFIRETGEGVGLVQVADTKKWSYTFVTTFDSVRFGWRWAEEESMEQTESAGQ